MDTRVAYTGFVGVVAVLRLVELRISKANVERLKENGAIERGQGHYPWMVAVHTGWLVCCIAEVWLLGRPLIPALAVATGAVFLLGMSLRYWTIRTLGIRWSTKVVAIPGELLEARGPFRWMRHPNYLGVALEISSLPLMYSAWQTALVFSVANAVVLRSRIRSEEGLLNEIAGREGNGELRRL